MAGRPSIRRRVVQVPPPAGTAALEALKEAAIAFGRAQGLEDWHRRTNALLLAAKLYAQTRSL